MNSVVVFERLLVQIWMDSSRGILVKNESTFKLPMKLLESCSTISVAKLNESLNVYLLVVNGSKIGTKYFASLCVSVCKANKIAMTGGYSLTHFLCTLQEHYSRSSSHWFQMSSCFPDILLESTSFLEILSMRFS